MNWRMMKSRMLEIKQCCWIHMIFFILAKRKWNLLILTRSWHFSFITMIIMVKNIKRVVKECQSDIDRLIGKTRIVVAERRNGNIGSCVFAKSSFSTQEITLIICSSVLLYQYFCYHWINPQFFKRHEFISY